MKISCWSLDDRPCCFEMKMNVDYIITCSYCIINGPLFRYSFKLVLFVCFLLISQGSMILSKIYSFYESIHNDFIYFVLDRFLVVIENTRSFFLCFLWWCFHFGVPNDNRDELNLNGKRTLNDCWARSERSVSVQ